MHESSISLIELLDFKISQLHVPQVTFLDFKNNIVLYFTITRLVIGTSRTVGSAKKFVRITSGFGGGEFPKTLRKVCTCQKLKFAFYCSNIAKSENAMLWRMLSRLETCIVYCCI
jgi:ribosomal protein L44E